MYNIILIFQRRNMVVTKEVTRGVFDPRTYREDDPTNWARKRKPEWMATTGKIHYVRWDNINNDIEIFISSSPGRELSSPRRRSWRSRGRRRRRRRKTRPRLLRPPLRSCESRLRRFRWKLTWRRRRSRATGPGRWEVTSRGPGWFELHYIATSCLR